MTVLPTLAWSLICFVLGVDHLIFDGGVVEIPPPKKKHMLLVKKKYLADIDQ